MTATIKPPDSRTSARRRSLRFSSLETLGFSDATTTWSDSPVTEKTVDKPEDHRRGRHEAEPDPFSDWHPAEIGGPLTGRKVRWSVVVIFVLVVAGAAAFAYWLYQRPSVIEQASVATVTERALALDASLSALDDFNADLLGDTASTGTAKLFALESEARTLFSTSGALDGSATELRSAALRAASSTLDGVRLADAAHSYRAAVLPTLVPPTLETDPELIALDEAARQFGAWQLSFDQMRTALPDEVLPDVTQQLDILAGDLTSIMGRYVDALREDDEAGANGALLELSSRLAQIRSVMNNAIADVHGRVSGRVAEARESLDRLLGR
ncbi:MAG TPA: hypothetical protein VMP13_06880 [Acidimicrobiia bacterium]|nr:hypothetical protein [Acidimicrobiia bacterium]